ncbi:MAG: hypothetical protein HMLKMBBP_02940 [Planctomycetes bacterium]|nr:hypothetical protein [Planctomycetota bacterium]
MLGLVAGLAAGAWVGLLLADGGSAGRADGAPRAEEPDGALPMPGDGSVPARPRAGGVTPGLPHVEAPPTPSGQGAVTGHVRDDQGKPISGVRVTLTPDAGDLTFDEGGGDEEATPEEEIRRAIRRIRCEAAARRSAVSGDDGAFRIDGLAEHRSHVVSTWSRDHDTHVAGNRWQFRAGDTIDVLAVPVARVRVEVTGADGVQVGKADLSAQTEAGDQSRGHSWTPASPLMRLSRQPWRLRATSGPHGQFESEEVALDLSSGPPSAPVQLRLAPRTGVAGTVSFSGPGRPFRCWIAARRLLDGAAVATDRLFRESGPATFPDDDGTFGLFDVEPGRWLVGAVASGNLVLATTEVEVRAGATAAADFAIDGGENLGTVLVRITTSDGVAPVVNGFSAGIGHAGDTWSSSTDWKPVGPGVWRVALADGDPDWLARTPRAADMKWTVVVQSASHGAAGADVRPGVDREVAIRLDPAATLDVTVSGAVREAGMRYSVSVAPVEDGEWGWSSAEVDASGRARVATLRPGPATVTLELQLGGWEARELSRTTIAVAPGANTLELSVPQVWDVTVRPDVDGARDFGLMRRDEDGSWSWCADPRVIDGTSIYPRLPAGSYRLRRDPGGANPPGEMSFALPGTTDIRFVPRPFRAARLDVSDGTPAHAAGFRTGDLIVAIDGKEFADWAETEAALDAARAKHASRFTVLRSGSRIEIESSVRDLDSWEPASL